MGSAGDVNGDGYSDVIVAAPNYGNGQAAEGRVLADRVLASLRQLSRSSPRTGVHAV